MRLPLNGFQLKVPESVAQPLRPKAPKRRPQTNKNFTELRIEFPSLNSLFLSRRSAALSAIGATLMPTLVILLRYDAAIHNQFNRSHAGFVARTPK